jgi:two-component system response regulator PilR (NtrC family)
MIRRVSHSRTSVLVSGESGTGKELVAKAIHYNSTRKDEAFVVVNCGAIPDNLMESEFFGHTKGAFTGAIAPKKGLFEVAHGGTIFLDEIAELSITLQVKLLRVLQERLIKPVGSTDEFSVDVRVVAATNKSLEEEVEKGNFREDLYYRLNVIQMRLPALRERKSDIALIAEHFVEKYCEELGREIEGFSRDAMTAISAYKYPGNVRELENVIERAVTFETSSRITLDSLPAHISEHKATVLDDPFAALSIGEDGVDLESVLESLERRLIFDALRKARGVRTEAAKLLNISFRSIRYKLDKYSISDKELDEFRHS